MSWNYKNITLRELIAELSKHEDLMDMEVESLGGGCGRNGAFHSVNLKNCNENGNHRTVYIRYYNKD